MSVRLLVPLSLERVFGPLIREVQLVLEQFQHPVARDSDAGSPGHVFGQSGSGPDVEGESQLSGRSHHRLAKQIQVLRGDRRLRSGTRSVVQPLDSFLGVPLAPLRNGASFQARRLCDLPHGLSVCRQQNDLGSDDHPSIPAPTPQLLQLPAGSRWQLETDRCRHDPLSQMLPAANYSASWPEKMLTFPVGLT